MAYLELSLGLGIASGPTLAFFLKFLIERHSARFIILAVVYLIYPAYVLRYLPDDKFEVD